MYWDASLICRQQIIACNDVRTKSVWKVSSLFANLELAPAPNTSIPVGLVSDRGKEGATRQLTAIPKQIFRLFLKQTDEVYEILLEWVDTFRTDIVCVSYE